MSQTNEQTKKAQDNIKGAWEEGDLLKLLGAGLDHFMNLLFRDTVIPFAQFLEQTGSYLDKYIQQVAQAEQLYYVGGKLILTSETPAAAAPARIALSADFYFQTSEKKWIIKQKRGVVDSRKFTDWDTDPSAAKLKQAGKLELSIEAPEGVS